MSRSADMLQYVCNSGDNRRFTQRDQLSYADWGSSAGVVAAAQAQARGETPTAPPAAVQHLYSVSQRLAFANQHNAAQHDSDKSTGSNVSSCSLPSSIPSTCPASSPPAADQDAASNYSYFNNVATQMIGGENQTNSATDNGNAAGEDVVVYLWSRSAIVVRCSHLPTAGELLNTVLNAPELGLPASTIRMAQQVFAIWICSPSLEVELGTYSSVHGVAARWNRLLRRWGPPERTREAPLVRLQRSATCPRRREDAATREQVFISELLWAEACAKILSGKYPVERAAAISLGSLQARLTLAHPVSPKDRKNPAFYQAFLPKHTQGWSATKWGILVSAMWWWRRWGVGKGAAEARLLDQLQPSTAPTTTNPNLTPASAHKLRLKYLDYCRTLPFYGAAFFQGQVERPVRGLASLLAPGDVPVLIAINHNGIYVIDDVDSTMLLGLRYEELSWESCVSAGGCSCGGGGAGCCRQTEDSYNLPCLFLQFMVVENGLRVSKILQIFSKQTELMDSLIEYFAAECRKKLDENNPQDHQYDNSGGLPPLARADSPTRRLANKLSRLSLATHDLRGELLGGAARRDASQPPWTPIRLIA